jgi:hypothetical protein
MKSWIRIRMKEYGVLITVLFVNISQPIVDETNVLYRYFLNLKFMKGEEISSREKP